MEVVKHVVNLLLATVFAVVALLFTAYGLSYKGLNFIAEHFTLLLWLAVGVIALMLILYYVFYFLKKQSVHRLILCAFICLDIFAVVFYTLSATKIISTLTSIEALRNFIADFGSTAVIIYIVIQFLQVVILPVPGSVTVAVGVALFGPLWSALYSFIGIIIGSVVAFFIGRVIGYKAVCWIVGKDDLDKWLEKLKGKDYLLLSIMFLLPLFPDDVLCFVAGLSSMTTPYFLIMITVTRLISVFTTAYSLDIIPFTTWWGILIWIVLIAIIIAVFYLVCKYSDRIDSYLKSKFKFLHMGESKNGKSDRKKDKHNDGRTESDKK